MTQTTQCGFCRETYEVEDQTYTPDAVATPLNQCATCARQDARGGREREYPIFEREIDERVPLTDWQPDDRVELVDWQPTDRVWLVSHA